MLMRPQTRSTGTLCLLRSFAFVGPVAWNHRPYKPSAELVSLAFSFSVPQALEANSA